MSAPLRVFYAAPDGTRLYSASDVAHIFELRPSAVSNWRKRENQRATLPAPAYVIPDARAESGERGYWTGAQLAELADARRELARERVKSTAHAARRARESLARAIRAAHRISADGALTDAGPDVPPKVGG